MNVRILSATLTLAWLSAMGCGGSGGGGTSNGAAGASGAGAQGGAGNGMTNSGAGGGSPGTSGADTTPGGQGGSFNGGSGESGAGTGGGNTSSGGGGGDSLPPECSSMDSDGFFSNCQACPTDDCDAVSANGSTRYACGCSAAACPCGLTCGSHDLGGGITLGQLCVR